MNRRPQTPSLQTPAQPYRDYRAKSYWLEQVNATYAEHQALEGMLRADVLIIGGGFTGISSAFHLKKAYPELRVVVLESNVVGDGASGRSAGFVTTLFGHSLTVTLRRFGRQKALQAYRYMERGVSYVGELVRAHNLDCEYKYPGLLRVATTPAYVERVQREVALAQGLGITGMEWIGAGELREKVDSPTYLGAWQQPTCALINPARFVRELQRVAMSMGVEIYERSPVTNLELHTRIRAQTPSGAVEADRLVIATNAFSAQFPQLRSRQFPIHTYIVLTEPLNVAQLDSLRWQGRQAIIDARNLMHYYRLTPDNRLLVGGGDAFYFDNDETGVDKHAPTFDHLERFIRATFPGLRGVKITHHWGGPFSATLDMTPVLGYIGDQRVIYSAGCMGNGMALAILNGQTISDMIGQQRTELTDTFFVGRSVLQLPPEPLRTSLANGILGIMRLQDAFNERNGLGVLR
ncbi:MAG TPA: FAD-binding oxidoreductase [Anaerolineae bacterium]|jgi:glycine/D-amino acid oxidase-like deaminating enzyme